MKFKDYPKIKTNRLILRQISAQDVDVIYALRSNPIVCKFIERPLCRDRAEAKAHIDKIIGLMKENASMVWVILFETKAVGTICLWNFSKNRLSAEVGYDLLPQYHNKGFMGEALQAVVTFGFNTLQLNTIEAFTQKANSNSRRLLERQGFAFCPEREDIGFPLNVIYSIKKPL